MLDTVMTEKLSISVKYNSHNSAAAMPVLCGVMRKKGFLFIYEHIRLDANVRGLSCASGKYTIVELFNCWLDCFSFIQYTFNFPCTY